jgi:hypothetical protein
MKKPAPPLEDQGHKCQNCGKLWEQDDLKEIEHLGQRVSPGEPMPSGECPDCGALCQPTGKELPKPTDAQYLSAARRIHHEDGEVEVDEDSGKMPKGRVSRGDDHGAYVLAWVWVPDSEARQEGRKGP